MTENKKYTVFNTFDGTHDYIIEETETKKGFRKLTIKYSNAAHWTLHTRGKVILSMVDTGNGVKLSKSLKSMDYGLLIELRILLNFEHQTDSNEINHVKYKVLENNLEV